MMAGKPRSHIRALYAWLRVVLPPWWAVGLFLAGLALTELVAHKLHHGLESLGSDRYREVMLTTHMPRDTWLIFGFVFYGFYRVIAMHPMYRTDYEDWLRRTPWTPRLPLPLGPVYFVPQDAAILLLPWLISLHASNVNGFILVACVLSSYLLAMLLPLSLSGANGHALAIAYGLALALWLQLPPLGAALALLTLYFVAWHGLPTSLREQCQKPDFIATSRRVATDGKRALQLGSPLGYPLAQLSPQENFATLSWKGLIVSCWLVAAWAGAFTSQLPFRDPADRSLFGVVVASGGIVGAAAVRAMRYFGTFHPPISLLGRVATGQWIIPRYDYAALPILFAFLMAAALLLAIRFLPGWNVGPPALGIGLMIVWGMPPSLRDWALTGNHRIVAPSMRRTEFIEL